jgi:hypothetical protein
MTSIWPGPTSPSTTVPALSGLQEDPGGPHPSGPFHPMVRETTHVLITRHRSASPDRNQLIAWPG